MNVEHSAEKGRGDDVILSCAGCGWTASGQPGDLVVSTQQAGACIQHRVVRP